MKNPSGRAGPEGLSNARGRFGRTLLVRVLDEQHVGDDLVAVAEVRSNVWWPI